MWGWILALLLVAALIAWIAARGAAYRRIFSDAHLAEVARGVGPLKSAALGRLIASDEDQIASSTDPRLLLTSAGLALAYTVQPDQDGYVHHYSVSLGGEYTARAVGEAFVLFVAELLGVPFDTLALGVGQSTVHHAEFRLSAGEHEKYAEQPVREVAQHEMETLWRQCVERRNQVTWHGLDGSAE